MMFSRKKTAAALVFITAVLTGCAGPAPSAEPTAAGSSIPVPERSATHPTAPEPTPGEGPPCDADRCFSLAASGDLLIHPGLWTQAAADAAADPASDTAATGLDFEPLLAGQRPYLENADLGLCQLETPVALPEGPFSGYPRFTVPPQILDAAKAVGYDACTTASNHTLDAGTEGLNRTLDTLDTLDLEHTGSYRDAGSAGEVMILQTPAARVAVITGTYGLNGLTPEQPWQVDLLDADVMIAKAERARAEGADVVVVALHAGDEYATVPNAQQVELAHSLADSGEVDFIYGHHTHSVLPIEKYNDTWIVYGLGNGVSELSPEYAVNNEGLMVRAQFAETDGEWTVSDLAWVPSVIVADPYRWCALAPGQQAGSCTSPDREAEVSSRLTATVTSLGADDDGARLWDLTTDR